MTDYERPSFKKEWWEEVRAYITNNPEEGFNENEVKEFIKYVVNRHMNTDSEQITKNDLKNIIEEINLD